MIFYPLDAYENNLTFKKIYRQPFSHFEYISLYTFKIVLFVQIKTERLTSKLHISVQTLNHKH